MTAAHLWNSITMSALITHLWQSTVFAGLAWLLTIALRNYPARIRFSVWMAASIKFLVPFAFLTELGSRWALPNSRPLVNGTFYTVMEVINQPFAGGPLGARPPEAPVPDFLDHSWISIALAAIWLCGCIVILIRWTRQWRRTRRLVNESASLAEGREVAALRNAEAQLEIRKTISVVVTANTVEPGIFGIVRPVLIWPAGLSDRMDDAHIASIVAHELEHVRRRDNLIAAFHTLVEAVFWFHPPVWWIAVRMTEEREQACDEEVLEQNAEPQTYADSILKVCAFCLESPLSSVVGISGSDLRKRVLRITSHRAGRTLTFGLRAMLSAATVLALAVPIGLGAVRGQSSTGNTGTPKSETTHEEPQFDVVSIKPAAPDQDNTLFEYFPDGTSFRGAPVRLVLQTVFAVGDDRIIGGPSWASTNRYDIVAKVAPEDVPRLDKLNGDDRRAMLIPLLADRFHLKYHHEMRERQAYALLIAKGGPRLTTGEPDPPPGWKPAKDTPPDQEHFKIMTRPGQIEADSVPMSVLAGMLSRLPALGRTVVDKTGLTGNYSFSVKWTPDDDPFPGLRRMLQEADGLGASATDDPALPLLTALREQLGLRLELQKARIDVIVIDHIDLPSPN